MLALKNKVALITGASSGIGYATAKLFAQEGAKVVVAARRQSELEKLVREIAADGGEAKALSGDVKNEDFAQSLVETAKKEFGGLDIAFNNAGTIGVLGTSIKNLSIADWEDTISTNLTSAFLGAKYQIPTILERGKGSVIFTSSFVGYTVGFPEMAAYAASKSGIIGLTQSLAAEFGTSGIRVNALIPGGTNTEMVQKFASTPEALNYVKGLYALKRLATPEEIARSALYLASDASSFTTGTALVVDGGVSINRS